MCCVWWAGGWVECGGMCGLACVWRVRSEGWMGVVSGLGWERGVSAGWAVVWCACGMGWCVICGAGRRVLCVAGGRLGGVL